MTNHRGKVWLTIAAGFVSVFVTEARADSTLYSTSFENPPFTTGAIAGQNGWAKFGNGISNVENTFAYSGSQAVFVNNNPTQSGPYFALSSSGPLIRESAELAIFTGTTESGWQFAATGPGLTGYMGGIDIDPTTNDIHAITNGFPIIGAFPKATLFNSTAWHNVSLLFDLATQTYSISLDGVTLDSNVAFCGNNSGPCNNATLSTYGDGFFDAFASAGATDSAYLDNYSVTLVNPAPEPASMSLVLGSLLAAAAISRRVCRRQR